MSLDLRPLASRHGRTGFVEDAEDIDDEDDEDEFPLNAPVGGDGGQSEMPSQSQSTVQNSTVTSSSTTSSSNRLTVNVSNSNVPVPTVAPSPKVDSETFINEMMAKGYKRDEAFVMYLRKLNADKKGATPTAAVRSTAPPTPKADDSRRLDSFTRMDSDRDLNSLKQNSANGFDFAALSAASAAAAAATAAAAEELHNQRQFEV
jgi:hypothetical protein